MTAFAWLQYRRQTLTASAALAALALAALLTGLNLAHAYNSLVAHCTAGCDLAASQFLSHQAFMVHALDILSRTAPALLGLFWGAPLIARELETGTYRLAWSQSITRSRWLVTKLAVVGLATALAAGVLTVTITWWYGGFHGLDTEAYAVFDRRDLTPVAYTLFAFALGALAGAVIRRTVPAMAATLAGFIAVRVAVSLWVRPHLLPPLHQILSLANAGPATPVRFGLESMNGSALQLIAEGSGPPGSWTLSSQILAANGHVATSSQLTDFVRQNCPNALIPPPDPGTGAPVPGPGGMLADAGRACLHQAAQTFHLTVSYQPANRYWTFQWMESGIFVALALACAAGCYFWVTRRIS